MIRTLSLALLWLGATLAGAQQSSAASPEPEYRDQYNALIEGRLLPLERETAIIETQSKRNFVITPSVSSFQTVRGAASPVRVTSAAHFLVRLMIADRDPTTIIHLRKLVPGKDDRRLPYMTIRGSLVPFAGPKHERPPDDSVAFSVQKYGGGSLEIIPTVPLAPGEYAFVEGNQAQCFGVDPTAPPSAGGSMPPQPQRAPQAAVAAPPKPVWQTAPVEHPDPVQEVHKVWLNGAVEAVGRQYPARLAMECMVTHDPAQPAGWADLQVNLQMPRPLASLLTGDFACEGDGETGSPSVYTEIGSTHFAVRNACSGDGAEPASSSPVTVRLVYEPALVRSLLDSPGQVLAVHIRTQPGAADNVLARFDLPAENAAVKTSAMPCVDLLDAARKRELASVVVACPVVEGAALSDVEVLNGPAMRPLAHDPENDIGAAWNLQPSTKHKQVPPKRMLRCGYKSNSGTVLEKKILPIPALATACVFRDDDYTNEPFAQCTR